jgi:hypothetical protein
VADRHREDYRKERRENIKQISVEVPVEKLNALDKILKAKGENRTRWIVKKIDEEISSDKSE